MKNKKNVVEGISDFDWGLFESGYNKKIKTKSGEKIYSHANYAQDEYNLLCGKPITAAKDISKDPTIFVITDLKPISNHEVLATINHGASNIVIDLNKETKYLNMFSDNEGNPMTPEVFLQSIKMEEYKKNFLNMKMSVQIMQDTKGIKASIWNGHAQTLMDEMYEQIKSPSRAYSAKIVANNNGGYFVEIMDTIKAFMPGSMAAMNKLTDFDALLGKTVYVMVESYTPKYGFVVSHKKYLNAILPQKLAELKSDWEKNPEKLYTGNVTGTAKYGVFIEFDGIFTGMLHKTLISDDLKLRWKTGEIENGESINVYIHNIEDNRIILSDVPLGEREAVIALREAEDELEKESLKTPEEKAKEAAEAAAKIAKKEEAKKRKEEAFNSKLSDLMEKFNR